MVESAKARMPRKQNPDPMSAAQQQEMVSEGIDNYDLPKSVVMKIAKSAVSGLFWCSDGTRDASMKRVLGGPPAYGVASIGLNYAIDSR